TRRVGAFGGLVGVLACGVERAPKLNGVGGEVVEDVKFGCVELDRHIGYLPSLRRSSSRAATAGKDRCGTNLVPTLSTSPRMRPAPLLLATGRAVWAVLAAASNCSSAR